MKKTILSALLFLALISPAWASDKIKITATTSTLASLASEITGNTAEIYYIASPNQNIHFINPTPKDVLKVRRADVFIHGGLDLEAWRGPLLDAAGRREFMGEDPSRAIDVSRGIRLKNIPDSLSRIQGDVHAYGNPHYWLDPENGRIIARNIAEGLSRMYPDKRNLFQTNLTAFDEKLKVKIQEWANRLARYRGEGVVVYHDSWPYFLDRFQLSGAGYLEPKPGIPPSPKHLKELAETMKEKHIKVIVREIYQENRAPKKLAAESGAIVVKLPSEAGQTGGSYFSLIDEDVQKLEEALKAGAP